MSVATGATDFKSTAIQKGLTMYEHLNNAFELFDSLASHDLTPETRAVFLAAADAQYKFQLMGPNNILIGFWADRPNRAELEARLDAFLTALERVLACDLSAETRGVVHEAIFELKAFDPDVERGLAWIQDVQAGRRDAAVVNNKTLFEAIRRTADVEIDYEFVEDSPVENIVDRHGVCDAWLVWECDLGDSDGIYLRLYQERRGQREDFATIKSAAGDDDAYRKMCALGAEYAIAHRRIGKQAAALC